MRTSLSPGSVPTARRWLLTGAVAVPLMVPVLTAPSAGAAHDGPHVTGTVTVTLTNKQATATETVDATQVATWRVDGPAVDINGVGKLEPLAAELEFSLHSYRTVRVAYPDLYDCTSEWLYDYGPETWTGPDLSGHYDRPLLRVDLNDEFHPGRARVEVLYNWVGPVNGTLWDRRVTPIGYPSTGYYCEEFVYHPTFHRWTVPFRILEDLNPATANDLNTVFHLAGSVTQNPSPGVTFVTDYDLTVTLPDPDSDGDGLTDAQEVSLGTRPDLPDTDGDTFTDGQEVAAGTDPLDPGDYPGNSPPEASAGGPYSGTEGSPVSLDGSAADADDDALALTWSYYVVAADPGTSCSFGTPQVEDSTFTCTDDGSFEVTLTADDGTEATTSTAATVTLTNEAPAITSLTPSVTEPVPVNTSVELNAPFTDPGSNDTHTCAVDWGDGSSAGSVSESTCSATHSYAAAGIYAVELSVTDDDGDSDSATYQYVVVYDPSAGFVTGGGWINSPVGAYADDPSLEGKADFGFVSKYKKGQTVPDGQTQFQFHAAGLNFHSTSYDWLVVAGPKAQYKGSGTVNGAGDYGFMLTANDGQRAGGGGVDKFRLKIWDKATSTVIYDNQMGDDDDAAATTAIAGGSIVIHN